jgi:uncharacterized protein (TIGR03000 family)
MYRPLLPAALAVLAAAGPAFAQIAAAPARITVRLPADARLYVDDVLCPLTGDTRSFPTPALKPGRPYSYTLAAEITENGRTIRVTRKVDVRPGEETAVNFGDRRALAAAAGGTPEVLPPPDTTPPRPKGPPPAQAFAYLNKAGRLVLQSTVQIEREETREKTVKGPDGKSQVVTYTVRVPKTVTRTQTFDPAKVEAYGGDGKRVDASRLPELLRGGRMVLQAADQQPPDPFYLQFLRDDALFLVPPPPEPKAPEKVPLPEKVPAGA